MIFTLFETSVLTIDEEKRILQDFVSEIPESYMGPDRVEYIAKNVDNLADQDKMVLKEFVNKALTLMIESAASDIEIGGLTTWLGVDQVHGAHGSDGQIKGAHVDGVAPDTKSAGASHPVFGIESEGGVNRVTSVDIGENSLVDLVPLYGTNEFD